MAGNRKPRKCDIVELAVWLHDTAIKLPRDEDPRPVEKFNDLTENQQRRYKFVAKELLTNPPVFLKEAL